MPIFRSWGPAVAATSPAEALRAGLGALVGLGLAGAFVLGPAVDLRLGLYLIAPFGATAVLLFAVPNSPLAQPWSAVVGNMLAAAIGVAVCRFVSNPVAGIALAVGLTISATILCRAVHPPAGAVAMTAVLSPDAVAELGFGFVLAPVGLGTVLLVLLAMLYARLTGRHYPLRPFDAPVSPGTPLQALRPDLSEAELTAILDRYRQSFNLGVEDLARLIGAAQLQEATHRTGPLTAADIMARSLVTIGPQTPLSDIAELFRRHGFASLPVVEGDDRFVGVIFQIHLITRAREDALRLDRGFVAAMTRLLDPRRDRPARGQDIMSVAGPRAMPTTPVAALLPMMADGAVDAVPVLDQGRIVGIVTRTDLIAALARRSLDG